MDEGGERGNGVWADLFPSRMIKFQFQEAGARSWICERRNEVARCIHNRPVAAGRFPGSQIASEVQWGSNTLKSGGSYSAY